MKRTIKIIASKSIT